MTARLAWMVWTAECMVPLVLASAQTNAEQRLARCVENRDRACLEKLLKAPVGQASPAYLASAAQGYALLGRPQEAVAAIADALKQKPGDYDLILEQARIYQRSGHQIEAIQSFLEAAHLRTPTPEILFQIGMSFFLSREYERAARHFEQARKLDEKNDKAEFMLGVIDVIKDNNEAGAKGHYERALALQPDNPHYLMHYGVLLVQLDELDQAAVSLERAGKLDPSNPLTHFNLGRLYRQQGELTKARAELQEAVRLRPELARAHYQLATVYRQLGQSAKAQAAMKEFMKFKDQDSDDDPIGDLPSYNLPAK
jgi:tetratricopeptide (TPR) repeat protein